MEVRGQSRAKTEKDKHKERTERNTEGRGRRLEGERRAGWGGGGAGTGAPTSTRHPDPRAPRPCPPGQRSLGRARDANTSTPSGPGAVGMSSLHAPGCSRWPPKTVEQNGGRGAASSALLSSARPCAPKRCLHRSLRTDESPGGSEEPVTNGFYKVT